MNRSAIAGVIIGVAVATAGGVFAGYRMMRDDQPADGTVTQAEPVAFAQQQPAPAADCVPQGNAPKDEHRIAGTAIGAIVGGAVGKDVGDRDITTAVGAAAGALAGNQIQKKIQEKRAAEGGC